MPSLPEGLGMFTGLILVAALGTSPMFVDRSTQQGAVAVEVRTSDLDLARDDQRAELRMRLRLASARACPSNGYPPLSKAVLECRKAAKLSAERAMQNALASTGRASTLVAVGETAAISPRQ